jgi:Ni,Fe-hydrogenase I small subunit
VWLGWTCTGCSGAMALAAHPAFIGVLVSFLIFLLSGFHLLRTANNR